MYTLAVRRDFNALHYLIGGDWGVENNIHSHHYKVEVLLEGEKLDQNGYLLDIVDIEQNLTSLTAYFADKILNKLPEFSGLNPSLENFAKIFLQAFTARTQVDDLNAIELKIWENDEAWAAYRKRL